MIKKNLFSVLSEEYLKNNMCICTDDLSKKILKDVPENYSFFTDLIDFMINLKIPYPYDRDCLISYSNDKNREFINTEFYKFLNSNNLSEDNKEHFIFDNIRHAFINFKEAGVLNMYQYREAEIWYPKIIISKYIGIKDDIDELDSEVIIYRGTSKDEFESKVFGQSWSIDENIANQFAFIHYKNQPDYRNKTRVLMQAKVLKEFIYYFKKNGRENEVIIDSNNIISKSVKILNEMVLK